MDLSGQIGRLCSRVVCGVMAYGLTHVLTKRHSLWAYMLFGDYMSMLENKGRTERDIRPSAYSLVSGPVFGR